MAIATSTGMHPIDEITDQIIAAAIAVHKKFGPGLLESVYTNAESVDEAKEKIDGDQQSPNEIPRPPRPRR